MDFKKKLKIRLFLGICYIVLGLTLIIIFNLMDTKNDVLSSFGFAMIVIGIVKIRNHILITKSDETIKKQQIAESDERNISISNKAKSISFTIYVLAACITTTVLYLTGNDDLASVFSYSICFIITVYWISYFIIRKKS